MAAHNAICRASDLISTLLADASTSFVDKLQPDEFHELATAIRDAGEAISLARVSPLQDARVSDLRAYGANLRLLHDELAAAVSHLRERRERVLQDHSQMACAMGWVRTAKWLEVVS